MTQSNGNWTAQILKIPDLHVTPHPYEKRAIWFQVVLFCSADRTVVAPSPDENSSNKVEWTVKQERRRLVGPK